MKLKPSAILFDMDGVLIDSLDAWWISLNSALKAFNYSEMSRDMFIQRYWGHDLNDNLKTMRLNQEVGVFCSTEYRNNIDLIRIYPDTKKTLQNLPNYKKGIITNTPDACARQIIDRFDIAQYFDAVITGDDVKKGKPSPEIVFKACTVLGVNPLEVVLIGDTDSDIKAGKAAGCTVVGVNINADVTIHKLSELTDLLR